MCFIKSFIVIFQQISVFNAIIISLMCQDDGYLLESCIGGALPLYRLTQIQFSERKNAFVFRFNTTYTISMCLCFY
jgi:hypothetical protein